MDPILTGAAANLTSDTAKGIFYEIKRHIRYVTIYKKNVEKFEEKMKTLIAKRESVRQEVDAAERNVEKIKPDVELWCNRADNTIQEEVKKVKALEEKAKSKCFIGLCPNIKSRYQVSRKAEEDVVAVDELLKEGVFDKVASRDVPASSKVAPSKNFKDFDSRKEVLDDVTKALKDSSISMIGVYGTGGVGKTTLVDEVARRVQEVKLFDCVVQATVTRTPNIEKIQDQIAESLSLKLEEKSIPVRASWLLERLKKEKKILVVLDDIWARLDLEEVGIPFGGQHEGCKILLTSRNQNVLTNDMDAKKTFSVDVLNEKEAWELFEKMAGDSFENPELRSVATEVAKKCAGLPVAIETVARALKNKDLFAWKDAYRQLQRPSARNFTGVPAAVYSAIELSYNSLESEELKQTFLLCGLLGHNAHVQDLLRYALGLQLLDDVNTIEDTRNRVLTLVSELKASCLLQDSYSNERFNTHDFVCDVALAIASRDKHAFVLKHEGVFDDWPNEGRMRRFKMFNLSFDSVKKLPHEFECPELEFFSMGSKDSYVEMPAKFFEKMNNIKVLDLIKIDFSSISLPTSLRTLCLNQCVLGDLVNLGRLKNLEILSFSGSNIAVLPKEIGELTTLRSLDLSRCSELRIISAGVLSSLSKLEELYMGSSFVQWNQRNNASLAELKNLSCLTTLDVHILDAAIVPNDLFSAKLQRYKILIGDAWDWLDKTEYSRTLKLKVNTSIDRLDDGLKLLLKKTEALYLEDLEGVKIVLNEVGNREGFLQLKHLHIRDALGIQYIMNDNDAIDKIAFRQLQSLTLESLPQLISFCSKNRSRGPASGHQQELVLFGEQMEFPSLENLCLSSIDIERIWHNQFSVVSDYAQNLTSLNIKGCDKLKHLLSSSMAKSLAHLRSFEIAECKSLKEIISMEDIEEENRLTILFPRLSTLKIRDLQHLIGYCSECFSVEFPSLNLVVIERCPELKGFVYKSTMEENHPVSTQAVLDEKVGCWNLGLLHLSYLNIQRIWDDQLFQISSYARNLELLNVEGCHNLKCLFSFSMLQSLVQLQNVYVADCGNMEEVVYIEEQVDMKGQIFPKLEFFMVKGLPKLKRFCHGSYIEFPLLKWLRIENCPTFETFISGSTVASETHLCQEAEDNSLEIDFPPLFNEKVSFPLLERLRIMDMGHCKKIWDDQVVGDSFCKLELLWVIKCKGLLNIFPPSMRTKLHNLEQLWIRVCDSLEEIFEPEALNASELHSVSATQSIVEETATKFRFPKLTDLQLYMLPKLRSFYSRTHTTEWLSLKTMLVYGCDEVEIFASESLSFGESTKEQPLFWVNEATFPNLEELKLEWNDIMKEIWHGQAGAKFFYKLKVLELVQFPDESAIFPYHFIQSLPNLEKLVVSKASFSQIFHLEGLGGKKNSALCLTRLNELSLSELPELTHLWKDEYGPIPALSKLTILQVLECDKLKILVPSSVSFSNLRTLEVSRCHGLVNLVPDSTAKSLVQLTRLSIIDCKMIQEIIACNDAEANGGIIFRHLKYLQLSCLPSLASFSLGNHSFEFPKLEKVSVIGCPKMEIFSQGDLRTPMLQRVQFVESEDEGCWEGNLNTTVQWLFAEKVGNCGFGHLTLSEPSKLMEIWRRNPQGILDFKTLKLLEVYECSTLEYLFTLSTALELAQLHEIKVKKCIVLEHIIKDEGSDEEVTNKIAFPMLSSVTLESCANLASFYQGSKLMDCPSLKEVNVDGCPEMFAFASTYSREQRTEMIDDGGNLRRLSKGVTDITFFNNTVVCPNLKDVQLSSINVQRLWDDQLLEMPSSVANLSSLIVKGCHNLRCLFASSMMQYFVGLLNIEIHDCKNVEEVVFMEGSAEDGMMSKIFPKLEYLLFDDLPKLLRFCHGSYFEFPSLRLLRIENCPALKTFISDSTVTNETHICQKAAGDNSDIDCRPLLSEKVAFPQLEKLRIMSMENCRKIWPDQLIGDSFCKLDLLWVIKCDRLVNIFSLNMMARFQNLEDLRIRICRSLEDIFEPEVLNGGKIQAAAVTQSIVEETTIKLAFPKLTYLELYMLPRLRSFYSRMHTMEWPSLKKMWLYGCDKVQIFASEILLSRGESTNRQPLFWVNEVTFPYLEELKLEWNDNMNQIWHGPVREKFFCKLKVLELVQFPDKSAVSPCCFIQSLPNLENLVVSKASFSHVFHLEGLADEKNSALGLTQLNELTLSELPELTHLWNDEYGPMPAFSKLTILQVLECGKLKILVPSSVSFENLTTLEVSRCHGLVNLIVNSTAKSLVHLAKLTIIDCEMIEEIIACEGDEVNGGIIFTHLKYLQLCSLPSLATFSLGNHSFEFPKLEKVIVIGCPKMKTFSQGDLITPVLQRVQFVNSEDEGYWEGNLNNTIQLLFAEKVGNCAFGNLTLTESSKLMEVWRRNPQGILDSKSIKVLEVHDCSTLECLLTLAMALELTQLCEMKIKNCIVLEHIIKDEGSDEVTSKIALPMLSSVTLESCANLASFYQGSKLLECPSLKEINVDGCPNMSAFASTYSRDQRIEVADGGNLTRLSQGVKDTAFFNNMVVCPSLEKVQLFSISIQRIWDDQLLETSSCVPKISLIVKGCHNIRCLFSSSMMFVQLRDIQIYDCKNVEEVIFIEGSAKDGMMSQIFPKLEYLLLDDLPKLLRFCHGSYFEFSSLRLLRIENCPALKTFISDSAVTNEAKGNNSDIDSPLLSEKVAFPQLEALRIMSMENCRKIWPDQLIGDAFGKLNLLWVIKCKGLQNIFPRNMRARLQNLEEFRIRGCHSVEEIFESEGLNSNEFHAETISKSTVKETTTNFVFPKLTYLELIGLSELKSFYSRRHSTEWPSLKKMVVFGCDKVEIFASESLSFGESTNEQPLFRVNEVTFPNLEELKLEWNEIMKEIWHGQLRVEFFCKLKVLELIRFPDKSAVFPYCFIQSLPYLEKLVISKASFSQIFHFEGFDGEKNHASAITSLKELELFELPELTQLWKEEYQPIPAFCELRTLKVWDCGILKILVPSSVSFENLVTLEVSRCHGVVNLITCSTAKSLVQLKRITITDCEMIEKIIACECDEAKGGIVFTQLKYLQLSSLPTLASFCLGDHNFEFPALEKMIVRECPKMNIFCQGDLSTPQLQKVILAEDGGEKGWWEGDLKTTIRRMFEE